MKFVEFSVVIENTVRTGVDKNASNFVKVFNLAAEKARMATYTLLYN